jgi:predicted TIM-barrel fold metal-dependent hydrolase
LPDKCLLGSDAPHGRQEEIINVVRDLPVAEAVKNKWLGENAVGFLDLGH